MTAVAERGRSVRTIVSGTALLSTTMLLVAAANYGLNFVLARLLDPAAFGDAALAITLVLTSAIVAATVQLVASKSVAAAPETLEAVRRTLVRIALGAGAVALAILGGGAWLIADALNLSTPWMLVIIANGLPVYFVQAVHRGALQGQLRFSRLALSYGVEAAVRVGVVIGLVAAGFGVIGAAVGILLSFVASALVARAPSRVREPAAAGIPWASLKATVLLAAVMLLGQTLFNNADLVISKAVLDPATAGTYAAAAVLGRSVFFVSWSVVQVVFPVIASGTSTPQQRLRAVATAVGVIVLVGAVGVAVASLAGDDLVRLLFGAGYGAAGPLLVPYLVLTSLVALASLFAAIDLARGRARGPVILAIGAVLQTTALALWATTPQTLVLVQIIGTSVTVIALTVSLALHARQSRRALSH